MHLFVSVEPEARRLWTLSRAGCLTRTTPVDDARRWNRSLQPPFALRFARRYAAVSREGQGMRNRIGAPVTVELVARRRAGGLRVALFADPDSLAEKPLGAHVPGYRLPRRAGPSLG